ncbi:MAG: hypothetical protein HQL26_03195 [Candidatus Omnitrophica bacterium]|nr:hypothetical protein [Candidatus Omnitrophota bacterium]
MKLLIIILGLAFGLSGCSVVPKAKTPVSTVSRSPLASASGISVAHTSYAPKLLLKGFVFGKTDFEGILKTTYVRLVFINRSNPSEVHVLIVGDKSKQNPLGWNSETVEPGYFFIELPAGAYRIIKVAIPVGAAMAEENTNVVFKVDPSKVNYVGTLHMVGTKEKLKLGGIPVIKPGFDYTIDVVDDYLESAKIFALKYPEKNGQFINNLMKINVIEEGESR